MSIGQSLNVTFLYEGRDGYKAPRNKVLAAVNEVIGKEQDCDVSTASFGLYEMVYDEASGFSAGAKVRAQIDASLACLDGMTGLEWRWYGLDIQDENYDPLETHQAAGQVVAMLAPVTSICVIAKQHKVSKHELLYMIASFWDSTPDVI